MESEASALNHITHCKPRVRVAGSGRSVAEAFQQCMHDMRKQVYAKFSDGIVLQIEPLACAFISVEEATHKEKFFGLFFPRERSTFKVEAEFMLGIKVIETDSLSVRRRSAPDSVGRRILEMR